MIKNRRTFKSLITLLVVFLASFFVWVFLQGQSSASHLPNTPAVIPKTDFIVNIPQKALWGNYVTVSLEADPETTCKLTYVPPLGETLQTITTANSSGLCTWRWKVDESQGKGHGRLIFTINGISKTHFIEIRSGF